MGLYSRAWRARYGEEVADLIEEQGLSFRAALDLLRGAGDAHRHLGELAGMNLSSRLRHASVVTLGAWAAFVVAACGLVSWML
jgi:hypothetical protein